MKCLDGLCLAFALYQTQIVVPLSLLAGQPRKDGQRREAGRTPDVTVVSKTWSYAIKRSSSCGIEKIGGELEGAAGCRLGPSIRTPAAGRQASGA